DTLEFAGRIADRFFPRNLLPWILDALTNHWGRNAILMGSIAPCKTTLDARMSMIGTAMLARHHANDFFTLHLRIERTTNPAVGTCCCDSVLRYAVFNDGVFHQGGCRTSLHAGAAGYAF